MKPWVIVLLFLIPLAASQSVVTPGESTPSVQPSSAASSGSQAIASAMPSLDGSVQRGIDAWLVGGFALVALVLLIVVGEILMRGQKINPPKKSAPEQEKK